MSTQTTQSRKHVQDPSQRSPVAASADTATEPDRAPVAESEPVLFCPSCGMPNSFGPDQVCRFCRRRYCPTCGNV